MRRMTTRACVIACALAIAGCSGNSQNLLSPTGATPASASANADGSMLKVSEPRDLGPNGVSGVPRRPTLTFTNSTGKYASTGLAYEIEVVNAAGTPIYLRTIGETPVSGSHTMDTDLNYAENYWFRVRARLSEDVGPWANFASFRTLDPPAPPTTAPNPTPTPGGTLPFPIPAACNIPGGGNGFPCVAAVAALSVEWGRCAGGSGVGCHRFSRQVVNALASFDPGWQMITAAPGGHACNCNVCGPSDGTMFREDTTVYRGGSVFDMIVGAGGPAPGLNWSFVGAPRPGDIPALPAVCP